MPPLAAATIFDPGICAYAQGTVEVELDFLSAKRLSVALVPFGAEMLRLESLCSHLISPIFHPG